MAMRMVQKIQPNFLAGVWGPECKGELGMIHSPGRFKPHQPQIVRNLEEDLRVLKQQYKVKTLVSLIQQHERPVMRVIQKKNWCEKMDIKYFSYPIQDFNIPTNKETFKQFVKKIVDQQIRRDKIVIAHCKAGLGRTGLFASSCLIYAGFDPQSAIKLVRKTRPGTIQTDKQVQFVKALKF